ncbi:putative LPS assembly protein LptD [Parapedobacter tibetensis]|uniref:putative LPS assembly protein LptD n=1 Tax=Parapedobacter tibetensis TaxID=2972951 RepID=UPI00214D2B0C|nr:putative LPS assembly protein LptD [Parapedobacter tibetensis]
MSNLKSIAVFFSCILLFLTVFSVVSVYAQKNSRRNSIRVDSLRQRPPLSDTTRNALTDTLVVDSLGGKQDTTQRGEETPDGLKAMVSIVAADSQITEMKTNIVHLYKEARIKYEGFELAADYIRVNQTTNEVFASGLYDHNDKYRGRPVVIFPNETPKAVDSLRYNFDTGNGITHGIFTEVEGGYIQASRVRKNRYNEMSLYRGMYSTCNLPEPHTHFGIQISKGIVTENQIIAGPSYLVIESVPLKFVAIPFGFFPKPDKRSSGFLFPTFGEEFSRGFFMRDIGWYLAFNDYWDSEIRGTLYSKGSYEASILTRYKVNYKFDGGFNMRYANTRNGVEGTPEYRANQDFNVTWNHSQRQEANPGTTFSANVNFGTSSYFQNTAAGASYDYDQLTRNNMSSSISYGKVFADGKVNFTSSLSHRQDMAKGEVFLELPTFSLNVSSFNPFDSKDRVGEQKWYQRITMGYSLQGRNSVTSQESGLFSRETLDKFQNGFQHNIPINLSLNAFKFFQFNTSVNYTERWYLQSIRKRLENSPSGFEEVRDTLPGFNRAYDYSISSGLSTKIYGMYPKIGKMQAMRHVITPSINLNYRPDFSDELYGFYRRFRDAQGNETQYSIFEGGMFGGPGRGRSMGIGFSIDNNLEAKILSKKDTTDGGIKKVPILQGLTFSGNYNFVADSFNLSNINFSGRTAIFNQKINLNFNGTFDPYSFDQATGRRVNRFAIKDGKLARLTNFGLSFDYSFNPEANESRQNGLDSLNNQRANMTPEQQQALSRISSDPNAFVDFNIPWNLAGSFSFQYSNPGNRSNVTATLNVHGDFSLTPKWKVQFNSGYDFRQKEISLTRFSIYRDLHCWDMSFGWVPFGRYQSYNVTIRAKSSILQDLKLTKRNDSFGGF